MAPPIPRPDNWGWTPAEGFLRNSPTRYAIVSRSELNLTPKRWDLMSNKTKVIKKITATNDDLKKALTGVRSQLTKTETKLNKANAKAERFKKEAAAQRTAAARADARAETLQKKLSRATAALKPVQATQPPKAATSKRSPAKPATADGLTIPDQTWTVVQLRAEAHARGITGLSNKPKPQLLAALNGNPTPKEPAPVAADGPDPATTASRPASQSPTATTIS